MKNRLFGATSAKCAALAVAISLSVSQLGCSWSFVDGPQKGRGVRTASGVYLPDCDKSSIWPYVDAYLAAGGLLMGGLGTALVLQSGDVGSTDQDYDPNTGAAVFASMFIMGVAHAWSARDGFRDMRNCHNETRAVLNPYANRGARLGSPFREKK